MVFKFVGTEGKKKVECDKGVANYLSRGLELRPQKI